MKHIPLWFWRFWYPVAVYWWVAWSRVHQWQQLRAWQKDHVYVPRLEQLPTLTPQEVAAALARVTYRADGAAELWDAIGHPATIEHLVRWTTTHRPDEPPPQRWLDEARDCDDFAQWAALRMRPSYAPEMVAVAWVRPDGRPEGHVVCSFVDRDSQLVGHVGNWGLYRNFASAREFVESIYRPTHGNRLVGYAAISLPLSVRLVRTGAESIQIR
jgi:hypothetical protein